MGRGRRRKAGLSKEHRKRWPVTNTDELTRHIARQLPEVSRRQVAAVLQLATSSIVRSLEEQLAQGYHEPSVTLRRFGTFELKWVPPRRRRLLDGSVQAISGKYRMVFRLYRSRSDEIKRWRTSPEEVAAVELPPQESPANEPPPEPPIDLPDVPAAPSSG